MKRHRIVRPDGAVVSATMYPAEDGSDAPCVIFVPGWLCDASSWDATARRLSVHRTCVTLDLPGFGQSDAGARTNWSLAGFGADVAAVAAALSPEPAVIVGHSMGGAVALEAAIALPDRVAKVVAVDSFVYPAFYDPTPEEQIDPIVALFAGDFPTAIDTAMTAYLRPGSPAATRAAIRTMTQADVAHGLATLRHFLRWSVDDRLGQAHSPISIIAARDFLAPEMMMRWQSHDLHLIKDVGHFIMLDDPVSFDRMLLKTIAGI